MNQEVCWKTLAAIVRRMTEAQLLFAIVDAREALECAKEFEAVGLPNGVGKYTDQISAYEAELQRRYSKRR